MSKHFILQHSSCSLSCFSLPPPSTRTHTETSEGMETSRSGHKGGWADGLLDCILVFVRHHLFSLLISTALLTFKIKKPIFCWPYETEVWFIHIFLHISRFYLFSFNVVIMQNVIFDLFRFINICNLLEYSIAVSSYEEGGGANILNTWDILCIYV